MSRRVKLWWAVAVLSAGCECLGPVPVTTCPDGQPCEVPLARAGGNATGGGSAGAGASGGETAGGSAGGDAGGSVGEASDAGASDAGDAGDPSTNDGGVGARCGSAARSYAEREPDFSGEYCVDSVAEALPPFPSPGWTSEWTCVGLEGTRVECTASRTNEPRHGQCGPAVGAYQSSATGFRAGFCTEGQLSPSAPAFPAPDSSTTWTCAGMHGGDSVMCTAFRGAAVVNGRCGPARDVYPTTAIGFAGALCAEGNALPATVPFPAAGAMASWTCVGLNGGTTATCSASRQQPPVIGRCGPAATQYPSTSTAYVGALCSNGTAAPAAPAFPAIGSPVSWTCQGSNGGANETCTASRGQTQIPSCGNAATQYPHDATGLVGQLCTSGVSTPSSPAFPAPGGSTFWMCGVAGCSAARAQTPIDGRCGGAHAGYSGSATAFAGPLCERGTPMPATVAFPANNQSASWSCVGQHGGTTASCSANRGAAVVDGRCGNAATSYAATASGFTGTLCSAGTSSPAAPAFPAPGSTTTWQCVGANGGTTASCDARRALPPIDGQCGPASGATYASTTTTFIGALCAGGTPSPAMPVFPAPGQRVGWSCIGANGGSSMNTCEAMRQAENGLCGPAQRPYTATETAWVGALCSSGSSSPSTVAFPAQGATVMWTCVGSTGGTTASCSASRGVATTGVCGSAARTYSSTMTGFSGAFCQSGAASPVSPSLPAPGASTTWTCLGANGGANSGPCVATRNPTPVMAQCGSAATTYPSTSTAYFGALCNPGTASPASPAFPVPGATTNWTCLGANGGGDAACTANRSLPVVHGVCGAAEASYGASATTFAGPLCASGTALPLNPAFPAQGATTTWDCRGANGGSNDSCSASRAQSPLDGVCGAAEREYGVAEQAFVGALCASGIPSPSNPAFPAQGSSTSWTCHSTTGGSTSRFCVASRLAVITGQCGSASGDYVWNATSFAGPACAAGTVWPGSPPFPPLGGGVTWECHGANGGGNASCGANRAPAPIDGECGPAQRTYTPSEVGFDGPLCNAGTLASPPVFPAQGQSVTWTCQGQHGGAPQVCGASRLAALNGVCGTANGSYVSTATSFNGPFCDQGTASPLSPPFPPAGGRTTWQCLGVNGGSAAPCEASRAQTPQDGVCGPAVGVYGSTATGFAGPLCQGGVPSPSSPTFPAQGAQTSWVCQSTTGGQSSGPCTASRLAPVNGACGPADGQYPSTATSFAGAFCAAGSASPLNPSFPPAGGGVTWQCVGENEGTTASCGANRTPTPIDGDCGPAAQVYQPTTQSYVGAFCDAGFVASTPVFPAQGQTMTWTCSGLHSGSPATCTAERLAAIAGACGAAQGSYLATETAYRAPFCEAGTASPANPAFPSTGGSSGWSCLGLNGGSPVSCTATRGLPLPTCDVSIERTSGSNGEPFKLTWNSNATSCAYSTVREGVPGATVGVACSGMSSSNFPSVSVGGVLSWTFYATGPTGTNTCTVSYTVTSAVPAAPCYVTVMPRTGSATTPFLFLWSSPNAACSFSHNGGPANGIGCSGDLTSAGGGWGLGDNSFAFSPTPLSGQTAATCTADFTVTP